MRHHRIDANQNYRIRLLQYAAFDHVGIEESEEHSRPSGMRFREYAARVHRDQHSRADRLSEGLQFGDGSATNYVSSGEDR